MCLIISEGGKRESGSHAKIDDGIHGRKHGKARLKLAGREAADSPADQ